MAQLTITKIIDGSRNAVFHLAIAGSGVGDLIDEIIIDPAVSFSPARPAIPSMSIDRIWYDLIGFDARLEFDYLSSDTPIWTMGQGQYALADFSLFGGLADRSPVLDGTGKLMLSTSGLGAGDAGTIIIKVHKTGQN